MAEYAAILIPVLLGLVIYFARLEGRLAKIMTDLCWIKKEIGKCPPS
jgi:hypothetical protein